MGHIYTGMLSSCVASNQVCSSTILRYLAPCHLHDPVGSQSWFESRIPLCSLHNFRSSSHMTPSIHIRYQDTSRALRKMSRTCDNEPAYSSLPCRPLSPENKALRTANKHVYVINCDIQRLKKRQYSDEKS